MPISKVESAALRKPKNPEKSRADILEAAIAEFASRGFDGARVDAIARQTNTARAMIYYYFKSKEGLYLAVLEDAYVSICKAEQSLDLAHLSPEQAIGELVGFTFDYYQRHPEFVALVVAENQAGGRFIRKMRKMKRQNVSGDGVIAEVLGRGWRDGSFRSGVDEIDVHMTIAALGWFQIANRHTFGHLFHRDFAAPATVKRHRALIIGMVQQFLRASATTDRAAASVNGRSGELAESLPV